MLKMAGKTVHLGGNIGSPLLSALPTMQPQDYAVLELSSFQLLDMPYSPHIAVITNLSPNHLDVHRDMQEYIDEYLAYDELSEEDMMDLLPFLLSGDMDKFDELIKEKKEKEKVPEKKTETDDKIIHIPLPMNFNKDLEKLEEEESTSNAITCSYEYDSLIAISKVDEDFYIIEDDDYEIALTLDQMMFLMESFNRIKDKPVKK
jgi:UDP-N-acetylmuramoylalanine-D-glutamate ligase